MFAGANVCTDALTALIVKSVQCCAWLQVTFAPERVSNDVLLP